MYNKKYINYEIGAGVFWNGYFYFHSRQSFGSTKYGQWCVIACRWFGYERQLQRRYQPQMASLLIKYFSDIDTFHIPRLSGCFIFYLSFSFLYIVL